MAEILTTARLLGFKDFFPNENPKQKIYYASKIGRDIIEKTTPFFLSYLKFGGFPDVPDLLQEWFTFNDFKYYHSPYYYQIKWEYGRIVNFDGGKRHFLLSVESLLNLFLWVTKEKSIEDNIENVDSSITLPFLELILLFNDDVLQNYHKAHKSIEKYGDYRKIQRLIFACSFSQSDLVNIDYAQLFYTQIYKKAKLLEFLFNSEYYKNLLERLIIEFDCNDKEEYLKAVCSAVAAGIKGKTASWTVLTTKNNSAESKGIVILENLSLQEDELSIVDQNDYLGLRNKPFQKIANGEYRVIFELFLVKKIYNGLIFKLSTYNKDFLSRIRNDFSEGVLLYDILNSIFNSKDILKITGKKFQELHLKREPDFYLSIDNDILLFESKDFFMTGAEKLSYDFPTIEGGLMKDGRLKKAVVQLVCNIDRCLKKEIPTDTGYDFKSVKISPIIIVHDSLYAAPGLNYWVYYWFIDELKELKKDEYYEGYNFENILPVTVVEIDTLILYEQNFIEHRLDLIFLLGDYHKFVRFGQEKDIPQDLIELHARQSALSFSEFVRNYSHKIGIKIDFDIISAMLEKLGIE